MLTNILNCFCDLSYHIIVIMEKEIICLGCIIINELMGKV